jgi:hypothetical protein
MPSPPPSTAECSDGADSEVAAAAMASRCGKRVEVLSKRTETQQSFADPSGTTTVTTSLLPARVHRGDGSWAPIDLSLQARVDGTLAPSASVSDVSFSGGGTGPLVTWRQGGHALTLSWPYGALPAPVVSGDSATYVSVIPDVDLVVSATYQGFKHVLVVHTPAAAADPRIREVHFTVGGDVAVATTAAGGLVASVGGKAFASADAPFLWDAASATPGATRTAGARPLDVDPAGPRSSEFQAAPAAKVLGLAAGMSGKDLTLRAPAVDGLSFPLYLDPDWRNTGANYISYATSDNANWTIVDNFAQSGETQGAPQFWVGKDPSNGRIYRTFITWPIGQWVGLHLLSAHIDAIMDHSWPCTSNSDSFVYMYRTSQDADGNRKAWQQQIPGVVGLDGENPPSANEASCPQPNQAVSLSGYLVTDLQNVLNAGWSTYNVAISAAEVSDGTNESHQARWKRFNQAGLSMTITFNHAPTVGPLSTSPATPCVAVGSTPDPNRPFVNASPTLRAYLNDADPETNMTGVFHWQRWNGSGWGSPSQGQQGAISANTQAQFQPNLADGIYQWTAFAYDGVDSSAWAPSCEFEVDSTNPVSPTVTSTTYPANCVCGGPGTAGTFNLSSSADTVSFLWGTTNPPSTVLNAPSPGATTITQWVPSQGGPQNLYFQAIDRAGNASPVLTYPVTIKPAPPNVGRWLQQDPVLGGLSLADSSGAATTHDMTLTGAADVGAAARVPGEFALGLSGTVAAPQYASTSTNVLDSSKNWAASAWVKLATAPTSSNYETVLSQSAGTYSAFEIQARPGGWCLNVPQPSNLGTDNSVCAGTVNVGVWTHVAARYDGVAHQVGLFVNGVQVGSKSTSVYVSNGPLTVGMTTVGGAVSGVLQGSVSDVRVWQRAVMPGEFAALMDNPVVGKYRFGETDPPEFDESGHFHDLNFEGGASVPDNPSQGYDGTGLVVDGTGDAVSSDQVVHTDQSFTVSVWAKPSDLTNSGVVLSQDGTNQSGFVLKYSKHFNTWRFGVAPSDTASSLTDDQRDSTWPGAQSSVTPAVGRWDYLVATYDATAKQLRLYVNGALQSTVSNVVNWDATGSLRVGSDIAGTGFVGAIDELRMYAGVIPAWLGDWRFDAGSCTGTPVVCTDSATPGHSVTLASGASQTSSGKDGSGLHSGSGSASTSGALLDTTKSYTVSAWVNLTTADNNPQTALSQPGSTKSAFELGYQPARYVGSNTFCMSTFSADTSGGGAGTRACSASPAVTGTWVHLVGVYDAVANTLTLYVNGGTANGGETVTVSDHGVIAATGALAIGRAGTVSSPAAGFGGDIDNVRIYQGVITDPTLLM